MNTQPSANFAFLAHHDPRLVALGTQAEEHFAGGDANVTLFKLRQFCELLAKRTAARFGQLVDPREELRRIIDTLFERGCIGATPKLLFHQLRRAGNEAVHEGAESRSEALHQLKVAHELAVWFQRTFGNNRKFDPGPFIPPAEPQKADAALHAELAQLREHLAKHAAEAEAAARAIEEMRQAAEAEQAKRLSADERAAKAREDAAIWEELAAQLAAEKQKRDSKLDAELAALQAQAIAAPAQVQLEVKQAEKAAKAIELDEAATRKLIDAQLREAGWEVDSKELTYERGARATKTKNLAIAEWPTHDATGGGRADYVLFAGMTPVAVVEAKRFGKDVGGVMTQAKRYGQGYLVKGSEQLAEGGPWGTYKIPFLFSTNGRPYLRQLQDKSGIHFWDARRATNTSRALESWYTPQGLLELLRQDQDKAHAQLEVDPMPYIDRGYQRDAILAVEHALAEGKREMLVAMATGTGKTRTCIGLCYRLLKSRRFRRILFLVDRNALGKQTFDAFGELKLEHLQSFTEIFEVKALADIEPGPTTKLQIATIQAMVRRVLGPHTDESEKNVPPVDEYDCIVVDECHRGYLLDRELSERELEVRDEDDYISKYRRVLDHFDAAKIGLTATPALHTAEIFGGAPVYSYSYREAVVDGFLCDHEPPLRIETELSQDGIHYAAREEVTLLDRQTSTVHKELLPDAVSFEVEHFNRNVVVEGWNRAVLKELVKHLDPDSPEKTLIFCATDDHADTVVRLMKDALRDEYGSVEDDAVLKITGETDKPLEAIRRYRNEVNPSIAVTVDLLTTGVDVPSIANLVFLRLVRSRILYEQMVGRATRLYSKGNYVKERFRIFDAVGLYDALKDVTDMKPVVVNPKISFEQLAAEIVAATDEDHRRESIDELLAKLQRKKRALKGDNADQFETAAGMDVKELVALLKHGTGAEAKAYFEKHASLSAFLDRATGEGRYRIIVSEHVDQVRELTRGYGKHGSRPPADYLEAFRTYLQTNLNQIPALLAITQRPRDLRREDLRKLRLLLDEQGFGETSIATAWREQKNEDVAATIVGYIRQLSLGSPLMPYNLRVDRAVARIKAKHDLKGKQERWLRLIAHQLKAEVVVDRDSFASPAFASEGGFNRIDKDFDGKLESLLGELADEVWSDAG